uniref:G-protein coupled receptors family 1 profile domain-containing protein n=1 Tax=Macaca fascicularis TaxID=9541 RepID=A0A7N9D5M9_MACFA
MGRNKVTWVNEFTLMGLSNDRQTQAGLCLIWGHLPADPTGKWAHLSSDLAGCAAPSTYVHLPLRPLTHGHLLHLQQGPSELVYFLLKKKTIFAHCGTRFFFSLASGGAEFLLLVSVAYDHYVAICDPLHYMAVMSPRLRMALAAVSWLVSLANSATETAVTRHLPTCRHNMQNYIACEHVMLTRLSWWVPV